MKQDLLRSLGLSEKEIRTYNAVLKEGALGPTVLAKRIGVNRTTVYNTARSLVEKGLLIEDMTKRPRVFAVASPADIDKLITEERERLEKRENTLKEFSEELVQNAAETSYPVPKIRFVEEGKIEKFLHQESPKWSKILEKLDEPVWWGFQDNSFAEHYEKWTAWYWKKAPASVHLKLLTNQSEIEKKIRTKYPRRNLKVWKDAVNFISSTWVIGDYVVMINTRHYPFYLFEIHDALLSHDLREIFKSAWKNNEK